MTDIETLKVKDTTLINEVCDLGDIVIDKNRRWSIEFDDYGLQGVIDAIKADERERLISVISKGIRHTENNYHDLGFTHGIQYAIKAIKAEEPPKDKC